ncbi:ergothioneine biosynthesis protein EgtC [Nocardia fluminea]|uniref:Gamma-glutamyl-hercynylcysteine sulfoxide hydrolase n=1 Tax=Nocardia fluminea TaxID=134984 RepID=A0A2N3VDL9_9NOCA|nr:ergothioneine biosynthesis protein EgtC [Nocardia fluminea]PKV79719.1 glutamine amidotransferase [Nocardia fluminea]
MCRQLGYVGPPVGVGELILRGPHSLYAQSWAPLDMRAGGTINADGFGVAWWRRADVGTEGARDAVTRYRNHAPIWTDPAVAEVLGQLESRSVVAAVRSATVGMPVERSACAPFTDEHWAFSHNGVIPDWRATLVAVLADLNEVFTTAGPFESPAVLLQAEALTDSAALWVLLRGLLASTDPVGPVTSPADALRLLVAAVLRHQPSARLNLLLGNGVQLWATTCWHALSVLVTDDYTVLSSEPYDADPRWQSVADRQLVTATPGHCTITALELPATERVCS